MTQERPGGNPPTPVVKKQTLTITLDDTFQPWVLGMLQGVLDELHGAVALNLGESEDTNESRQVIPFHAGLKKVRKLSK